MADAIDGKLSLIDALIQTADPAKLNRFDALAQEFVTSIDLDPNRVREEFEIGRFLIALMSRPGGSEAVYKRHGNLLARGLKDSFGLCREAEDLFASLISDFRAAGAAGRFSAEGYIGGTAIQKLDPQLFGIPQLQLRFDRNTIELPGGGNVFGVQIEINREHSHRLAPESGYRTGLAGKPSSWHLIEMECRRRHAD